MIPEPDRTRRLNEPKWERNEPKWYQPGILPPPGLYWFYGSIESPIAQTEGKFIALVEEDGWVSFLGVKDLLAAPYRFNETHIYGEWYGPFDCPPWVGETAEEEDEPPSETV